MEVPEVLFSGHHDKIRQWQGKEAIRRTLERRPDLLEQADLSKEERKWLAEIQAEKNAN